MDSESVSFLYTVELLIILSYTECMTSKLTMLFTILCLSFLDSAEAFETHVLSMSLLIWQGSHPPAQIPAALALWAVSTEMIPKGKL